ncbi:flagellar biosynthesis protein FlhF [Alkalilimnicola sp. S0819]|uniref:flagellar biosynthesis protein FlhF n=1 Tax=Alkalilimnicola sp. S0819 TaxID=2613922 RepID=UPI001261E2C1|nr:flagellar biosynthesis protein FlhF [Alkalilimnicola sp. S0819]KAB7627166.1 flagellar biosynthesis protein FlhF [Alkalilimnicola sp. S0819]MPQ15876.1 flagellar biosynthesis protein FlhF [Alkalilimnicola sp. S0819]
MKIKRIFAQDMRQAIRKVREEHGPQAAILSSRKVDGGVEVISAIDYDERAVEEALARQERQTPPSAPATPSPRSFAETLARSAAQAPESRPLRRKLDIRVDDDLDEGLSFAAAEPESAPEPAPTPEPAAERPRPAATRIEWSQDPAMQAMRDELKTLRSLFESQMTLMEWGKQGQRQPVRAEMLKRLNELGLGSDVCRKLADRLGEYDDPARAWTQAMAIIAKHLPVTGDDILEQGGMVAVVGPTGVGKTTTVAKLAARYALRHGRNAVALVSTDNFRIGAQDQLRNFARILGVPVHTAANSQELERVLGELKGKRLVLVDTAGMSQRDMRLNEQLQALADRKLALRPYLVVSANSQLAALSETVRAFRKVKPVGCIVTKLDEATSLGGVVTAVLRYQLPLAYLGTGQRVPEDLQPARSDRLIEQLQELVQRYREESDEETLAFTLSGAGHVG